VALGADPARFEVTAPALAAGGGRLPALAA
jgi:hypothetical protein